MTSRPATFKKRFRYRFFPVRFAKFLRTPLFLQNTTSAASGMILKLMIW